MKVNKSYRQNWVKQNQKQKHENHLNFHSKVIEKKQKNQTRKTRADKSESNMPQGQNQSYSKHVKQMN